MIYFKYKSTSHGILNNYIKTWYDLYYSKSSLIILNPHLKISMS